MNIGDIVIIYLALGAPIAVYKFFQDRDVEIRQRLAGSILTLLFWIPTATRLVYRSINNAYLSSGFVSRGNMDASRKELGELREEIRAELVGLSPKAMSSLYVREVLERYIGLGEASYDQFPQIGDVTFDLFTAAGRPDDKLAAMCLMRRNHRRIERHHIKARRSFLELFEQAVMQDAARASRLVQLGLKLASQLNDKKAVDGLEAIAASIMDEVWNPEGRQQILSSISATVSPLAMKTAPSNND